MESPERPRRQTENACPVQGAIVNHHSVPKGQVPFTSLSLTFSSRASHLRDRAGAVWTLRFLDPASFLQGGGNKWGLEAAQAPVPASCNSQSGCIHSDKGLALTPALLDCFPTCWPQPTAPWKLGGIQCPPPGQVEFLSLEPSSLHWTPLTPTCFLPPTPPELLKGLLCERGSTRRWPG